MSALSLLVYSCSEVVALQIRQNPKVHRLHFHAAQIMLCEKPTNKISDSDFSDFIILMHYLPKIYH